VLGIAGFAMYAPGASSTRTVISYASTRTDSPSRRASASRLHVLADEDRVSRSCSSTLAVAKRQHQVHEVGGLVAFERGHELLIVDANEYVVWLWIVGKPRPVSMCSSIARWRRSGASSYHGRIFTNG